MRVTVFGQQHKTYKGGAAMAGDQRLECRVDVATKQRLQALAGYYCVGSVTEAVMFMTQEEARRRKIRLPSDK